MIAFLGLSAPAGSLLGATPSVNALKQLSVEELMDLEVTSVSKRPEKLLDAPAAIQVVTGDEIRRSGASNIAEALRLVGNLDVAQENGHEWVISARGFASDVGNKLLVLMDGRTLYTPLFSGVFWDRQDYLLEDIARIEVISGPGGALWGANAVNGVINITTKSAADTQGFYFEAGGGTSLRGLAGARYGGRLAPNIAYRVYAKHFDYDDERLGTGKDASDGWRKTQVGFRVDAEPSGPDSFTVQGDFYRMDQNLPTGGTGLIAGGNLLGRWARVFSPESDMNLQFYYDRTHLKFATQPAVFAPAGTFGDDLDTYDLDFQHRFTVAGSHRFLWGLGYRFTADRVRNSPGIAFLPEKLDQELWSGFVQDEIALSEAFNLTLGTKVEHNDYTGFEVEPSVRLQWNLSPRQTVWAAVSRAVRTPSRIDRDISQPAPGYTIVVLKGGGNFVSETVLAYELGYRAQLGPGASLSLSTFFNEYDDVRSTSISPPDPIFRLPFPFFFENNLEAETYGAEFAATWQMVDWWQMRGTYSLVKSNVRVKPGKFDFNNTLNETSDPRQQFSLRSSMDLPGKVELNAAWRWVDTRQVNNAGVPAAVPGYSELDLRIGWHPTDRLELAVVGRNLLHNQHAEFGKPDATRIEMQRAVFGKLTWRY